MKKTSTLIGLFVAMFLTLLVAAAYPTYTIGNIVGPTDALYAPVTQPIAGISYNFQYPISCSVNDQITGYYSFSDSVNWIAAQTVTQQGTMTVAKVCPTAGSWNMRPYLYDNTLNYIDPTFGNYDYFTVYSDPGYTYTCTKPTGPYNLNGTLCVFPQAGQQYMYKFSVGCSHTGQKIQGYYSFSDSPNWMAAQEVTTSGTMTVYKTMPSASSSLSMCSYLYDNSQGRAVVNNPSTDTLSFWMAGSGTGYQSTISGSCPSATSQEKVLGGGTGYTYTFQHCTAAGYYPYVYIYYCSGYSGPTDVFCP